MLILQTHSLNVQRHTIALIPPEETNDALAWPACRTAPSKSEGKQLKQIALKHKSNG